MFSTDRSDAFIDVIRQLELNLGVLRSSQPLEELRQAIVHLASLLLQCNCPFKGSDGAVEQSRRLFNASLKEPPLRGVIGMTWNRSTRIVDLHGRSEQNPAFCEVETTDGVVHQRVCCRFEVCQGIRRAPLVEQLHAPSAPQKR